MNRSLKYFQKNRRVHTVSKPRLRFSNSKIAYKNTLNNFFVFFSKNYVKNKNFKKKKILSLDHFWRSYERKTEIRYLLNGRSKKFQNLPETVFRWVLKNVKKWRKSKIKIFQTIRFGVEYPIYGIHILAKTTYSCIIWNLRSYIFILPIQHALPS